MHSFVSFLSTSLSFIEVRRSKLTEGGAGGGAEDPSASLLASHSLNFSALKRRLVSLWRLSGLVISAGTGAAALSAS